MPKISVIMPAYNAEKYIREAIDSILNQSFSDFELIVINDCSWDSTEEIIMSYRDDRLVYLKNEENLGVARTLNRGLATARGEYIARMDADDISMPERFAKQVEFLDAHPNVAVLGTGVEKFGEMIPAQRRIFSDSAEQMRIDMFFSCGLAHPSVMMRNNIVVALGGYDAEYEGLEDYEFWCRLARHYEITTLTEVLFRYRVHGSQVTRNPSEKYVNRMRRLKARQLEELGLPIQGDLAEGYYNYCLGKRPQNLQDAMMLSQLCQSVIYANEQNSRYNPVLLRQTMKTVVLTAAANLHTRDSATMCKSSDLVSLTEVMWYRLKSLLR